MEVKAWRPLWLEFSGLPQLIAEKVKGGGGWSVFCKIVELDCAFNSMPGTVEISLAELGERCGVSPQVVRKSALVFRKMKLVACFLPEDDEEVALFQVRTPLPTPRSPKEIREFHPKLFGDTGSSFRYVPELQGEPGKESDLDPEDTCLQEVVDLYFNVIGLKMNAFVLDELRLVRQQFPIDEIRRTFRRAEVNEIRSLTWVVRELFRHKRKCEKESGQP